MQAEQALLQLCAGPAAGRAAAWNTWVAALRQPAGDAEPYPPHWRDLLPLAALRQRDGGFTGPGWLLSRLRTAALLEERRLVAVEDTAAEILANPIIAEHDPLMLGGLGLGQTVYPHPATRHTGIITLLLRPGTKLRPVMYRLVEQGYRTREGGWRTVHLPFMHHARLRLDHPSQMKLLLLSAPAWRAGDPLSHGHLRERGTTITTKRNLHFVGPTLPDALALSERHISGEGPASLVPLVDARLLMEAMSRNAGDEARPEVSRVQ